MKLDTVAAYNLRIGIMEDNPGLNYFKRDIVVFAMSCKCNNSLTDGQILMKL